MPAGHARRDRDRTRCAADSHPESGVPVDRDLESEELHDSSSVLNGILMIIVMLDYKLKNDSEGDRNRI